MAIFCMIPSIACGGGLGWGLAHFFENLFCHSRLPPSHPPMRYCQLRRGGHTGAIRCTCAISADMSEPPADTKCQFSGITGGSRLSFRRINVQIMQKMQLGDQRLNPLHERRKRNFRFFEVRMPAFFQFVHHPAIIPVLP